MISTLSKSDNISLFVIIIQVIGYIVMICIRKKNFTITAREDGQVFEMKLVPRSDRFGRRLNYLVVKLAKEDFLVRSLEVDGASGVNSVFSIEVTSLNSKIAPGTFEVYRPK